MKSGVGAMVMAALSLQHSGIPRTQACVEFQNEREVWELGVGRGVCESVLARASGCQIRAYMPSIFTANYRGWSQYCRTATQTVGTVLGAGTVGMFHRR